MRIVSVLDRVAETISRYNMLRRGDRIGIAVSGGIDSVSLLDILKRLNQREAWQLQFHLLHVNHQLRGADSDGDEAFVGGLAATNGLPFHHIRVALGPGNVEQLGREARRRYFGEVLSGEGLSAIATGHTKSDQAETVLFRLLRGTGLTGLAAVLPVTNDGLIRPLLPLERVDIEEYARSNGLNWRDDASNADTRLARNSLRHEWLPRLADAWNPHLVTTLSNLAEVARAEEDHWERSLASQWDGWVRKSGPGYVIAVELLQQMDLATQRRVIRRLHRKLGVTTELSFDAVEQVRRLAGQANGDGRLQTPGMDVMRSFEWLRFTPLGAEEPASRFWSFAIEPGKRVRIPGGEVELTLQSQAEVACDDCLYNEGSRLLDANSVALPLEIRSWRPGDRVNGSKVKQMFQESRIPLWERRDWPVLAAGDKILWTRRFGVAEPFLPHKTTDPVLVVTEFRDWGTS